MAVGRIGIRSKEHAIAAVDNDIVPYLRLPACITKNSVSDLIRTPEAGIDQSIIMDVYFCNSRQIGRRAFDLDAASGGLPNDIICNFAFPAVLDIDRFSVG